jgi:formylmethanofuran dehydrogenase subunit E/SAM-dependent methyltransferase
VVAVTETDMCAVDAIQHLTGCTFGKGNLIHRDWGKNAFTFFRRSDGHAVRVVIKPDAWRRDPEHSDLFAKVRSGEATDDERARFGELHQAASRRILDGEPDDLYDVQRFMGSPPPRARIHSSITCDRCGEGVMETRIRQLDGQQLCEPCVGVKTNPADAVVADQPNLMGFVMPSPMGDLSFLARPGELADWRAVTLIDAADRAGLLEALPGTAQCVSAAAGTDTHATRMVLDALAVFDIVARDGDGPYRHGPVAPDVDQRAVLHQHAGVIARWTHAVPERLAGRPPAPRGARDRSELARWLQSLGHRARRCAPLLADACLDAVSDPRRVLDLGGGHGEYALEFARRGLDVTMQDQPTVIDIARERGQLLQAGVTLFPGDFFDTLPEGPFDLVLLAGVAHTYPLERVGELYRRIHGVTGQALAISTFLRDADAVTALFAIQMLTVGTGADTHSEDDHRTRLNAAGFASVERRAMEGETRDLLVARPI